MCESTDAQAFELPHTIEAPGTARELVARHVCPDHGRDALAAAQLLVTELATCAVLYGSPPVTLMLECGVTQMCVSVTHRTDADTVAEIPIDDDGGLRSALLAKLSRSWGVEATPGGRTLWSSIATGALPVRSAAPRTARTGPVL